MVEFADPDDVDEATHSWTKAMIACRAYGHSWQPSTVTLHDGSYVIRQRCGRRCGTEREGTMTMGGYLHGWRMTYREGYLLSHLGRVDQEGRARIRLATLRGVPILTEDES